MRPELAARHGANSIVSVTFDVSDEDQVKGLVDKTIDRFGKIDMLVNNAALFAPLPTPGHRHRCRRFGTR